LHDPITSTVLDGR